LLHTLVFAISGLPSFKLHPAIRIFLVVSFIFRLPYFSPQEETQDRSDPDNGGQNADFFPAGAYDGADYIGGDEYLEAEQKVCPELLPDGFILAYLVRDSRPDLGAKEADHRFQHAPDDHKRAQDTDGKIDNADDPIEEHHVYVPPPLTPLEWMLPRAVANR
jgi:hypothetical protein